MPDSLFQEKINRIYEATETKTQTQLAEILGINQSTISTMKNKQNIPDKWLLTLVKKFQLNPYWVESAIGPKYLNPSDTRAPEQDYRISNKVQNSPLLLRENIEQSSFLHNAGRRINVYSSEYNGVVNEKDERVYEVEEYTVLPEAYCQENIRVFRYKNKNMEPIIQNNALVGIDISDKKLIHGEIYAFCYLQQGIMLAQVFHSTKNINSSEIVFELTPKKEGFLIPKLSLDEARACVEGKVRWTFNLL